MQSNWINKLTDTIKEYKTLRQDALQLPVFTFEEVFDLLQENEIISQGTNHADIWSITIDNTQITMGLGWVEHQRYFELMVYINGFAQFPMTIFKEDNADKLIQYMKLRRI